MYPPHPASYHGYPPQHHPQRQRQQDQQQPPPPPRHEPQPAHGYQGCGHVSCPDTGEVATVGYPCQSALPQAYPVPAGPRQGAYPGSTERHPPPQYDYQPRQPVRGPSYPPPSPPPFVHDRPLFDRSISPVTPFSPVDNSNPLAPAHEPAPPVSTPSPLKLVIKRPNPTSINQTVSPSDLAMSRRSANPAVKVEESFSSSSGRPLRNARVQAQQQMSVYLESDGEGEDDDAFGDDGGEEVVVAAASRTSRRSGRATRGKAPDRYDDEDDFEDKMVDTSPILHDTRRASGRLKKVVVDPDDEDADGDAREDISSSPPIPPRNPFPPRRETRNSGAGLPSVNGNGVGGTGENIELAAPHGLRASRASRSSRRDISRHSSADAESFAPSGSGTATELEDESDDPLQHDYESPDDADGLESRSPSPRRRSRRGTRASAPSRPAPRRSTRVSARAAHDSDDDYGAPKRQLRQRTGKVNYELPPLDISAEIMPDAIASVSGPSKRRVVGFAGGTRFGSAAASKGLPWTVRGMHLAQAMGDPDTSDSDMDFGAPMKGAVAASGAAPSTAGGAGRVTGPSDVPNFGRINPKSNMADADPLGVDVNVTFDNVGGLEGHINQLKEMVALPLLYPELFQQFGITPPRGVLFHGPPGTGKTLLARALAASCSTGNTKIAFFMRKGADVLSKWVGEAERQLRMLFEEARAAQPSIIFFDEIDGLAPVRSSKQDQIHASLVSTLLALMDGMDGRGQVIVIGATNRPDAVDPALRRPGRFDREFYFPLPNREARKKIIGINTRKWDPQLSDDMLDELAILTKGYGGADLRALCTESALNAIQRRYPQIYNSTDRLLVDPASIQVGAKDFMMSVKKITPSSARSTSSAAAQLPAHLIPLLAASLERLKETVDRVLPRHKMLTALEEAEFEDEIGDNLEQHAMVQSLDKMRTFRPRILVHGPIGMGQGYLGPAILHHLEGFHVQSLDLGTLMGDSASTLESSLVQLFVEAKRHQPSILFIPSLLTWSIALSESARTTFRALLDGVPSSDPVLLLAVNDGSTKELPRDVRQWFGIGKAGKVQLVAPTTDEREDYFASLIETFQRPPNDFPDALPRRKRIHEILPPAPPLPPRQPTDVEIQRELDRDANARNMMVLSFTGLLQEFQKKYRKVVAGVREDALEISRLLMEQAAASQAADAAAAAAVPVEPESLPNGHGLVDPLLVPQFPTMSSPAPPALGTTPVISDVPQAFNFAKAPIIAASTPMPTWDVHDVDLDTLHRRLLRHKYHTPADFLADVTRIEENASRLGDPDRQAKVAEMAAHARLHVAEFDPKWTPEFERLKVRMRMRKEERARERERAKTEKEKVGEKVGEGTQKEPEVVGEVESGLASGEGESANTKRLRDEEEGEERSGKRARDDAMDVDPTVDHLSTNQSQSDTALAPSIPGMSTLTPSDPSIILSVPPPRPAQPAQSALPARETPSYPPFILPAESLASFFADLKHSTSNFSVDQLEQLRAGCYDHLWRRRGEWDRTGVLEECRRWVVEFVNEVQEGRDEDEE